jgi:hypothetical protein
VLETPHRRQALKLLPFELRFLQRRQAHGRHYRFIKSGTKNLSSQKYHEISLAEDRFFIFSDYILLFKEYIRLQTKIVAD